MFSGCRRAIMEQRHDYAQESAGSREVAPGGRRRTLSTTAIIPIKPKKVRGAKPKALRRHRGRLIMECRRVRHRPRFRDPKLRRVLHPGRSHLDGDHAAARAGRQGRGQGARARARRLCGRRRHLPADPEARPRSTYHYATIEERRPGLAVDGILGKKNISAATVGEEEFAGSSATTTRTAPAKAEALMVGDLGPDRQAARGLERGGLRGIGFSFVN